MQKVILDNLPKNKNNRIEWIKTKGYKVKFIYEDIEDYIDIIDIKKKNHSTILTIQYKDKREDIYYNNFTKCKFGKILNKVTSEFKIEIGTRFQDDNRDITIVDRKKMKDEKTGQWRKYYKYFCNKCGFDCGEHYTQGKHKNEYLIEESQLLNGTGCACCCNFPRVVVENINSIYYTTPWMIKYFKNLDDTKKYTCQSNEKIEVVCPNCNRIGSKKISISTIYKNHSIKCACSDSVSYGEKIVFSLFEQLDIDFKTQLSKSYYKWCEGYRYDFYFDYNNEQYIIEVNGSQHYEDAWDKLEKTQENDKLKKELALANGIKEENYIVIDCRKSELNWIRNNENGILKSKLNELYNLDNIDWLKCEEFACSNLVKVACEYKRNNPEMTNIEIGQIMKYCNHTIGRWLTQGSKLGWCNYSTNDEKNKARINKLKKNKSKAVMIFKDNILLGIFDSIIDLSNKSEELYNVKLSPSGIAQVCRGQRKQHKNYTFKFV